jgi:hypothetical protein
MVTRLDQSETSDSHNSMTIDNVDGVGDLVTLYKTSISPDL